MIELPIILASQSRARKELCAAAGLNVTIDPAHLDEASLKQRHKTGSTAALAITLAEAKAQAVSLRHAGALVIGADQILECAGVRYDKAESLAEAAAHLRALSGRAHQLWNGLAIAKDGKSLWTGSSAATLHLRALTDAEIDAHLSALGPRALMTVGAYEIEGQGAALFSKIDGEKDSIMGLPLALLREGLHAAQRLGAGAA